MAKVEKTLNIKEFKSLVKKLIKEEIQKESNKAMSEDIAKEKKLNESLEYKKKFVVLEYRRKLIKNILIKEANWLDKLRGKVDPSLDVENPKVIKSNIDGALAKANKFAVDFNDKVLATTSAINDYHEAVSSALDKLSLLSGEQTWMPGMKQEYEAKIIDAAKTFYKIMNNEKGRIEAFTKTLVNDLQDKGLDKSYLTVDKKVSKPSFQVSTPKDVEEKGFVDKVIAGAKQMVPTK